MKNVAMIKSSVSSAVTRFINDEEAATAVEYGIIAALIAAVIVTAVTQMGGSLKGLFTNLNTKVSTASDAAK
jgi:pilus assembly protein Flp/PilA